MDVAFNGGSDVVAKEPGVTVEAGRECTAPGVEAGTVRASLGLTDRLECDLRDLFERLDLRRDSPVRVPSSGLFDRRDAAL